MQKKDSVPGKSYKFDKPRSYPMLCVFILLNIHFSVIIISVRLKNKLIFCFHLLDLDPYHLIRIRIPDPAQPLIRIRIQGNYTDSMDPDPQHWCWAYDYFFISRQCVMASLTSDNATNFKSVVFATSCLTTMLQRQRRGSKGIVLSTYSTCSTTPSTLFLSTFSPYRH